MIFYDTETCGLHGMPVLIQYAEGDGPIEFYHIWSEPPSKTLRFLEWFMDHEVVGFNLVFDHFHLNKLYTIWKLLYDKYGDVRPDIYIDEIADLEEEARFLDLCIKPRAALDLMLYARRGPFQSLMERKPIRVKRIPVQAAEAVREALEELPIDGIYFARKAKPGPKWKIEGEGDFRDIVLRFKASGSLKALAHYVLGEDATHFDEIGGPPMPVEVGWAPFAKALSSKEKRWFARLKIGKKKISGYTWPKLLTQHIDHWAFSEKARKYAIDDVKHTRNLAAYFNNPPAGDNDSTLAINVACVRWHGVRVDLDRLRRQKKQVREDLIGANAAKRYISEVMDDVEKSQFTSTKDVALEAIENWQCDCVAPQAIELGDMTLDFEGNKHCQCGGHPAAKRAKEVREARRGKKRNEVFDKILMAGCGHFDFKVIGTLSGRLSGAGGLSLHGIPRDSEIRACFPFADDGFVLSGGDFDAFEVVLALAAYPDKRLQKKVQEGLKIHALFAAKMFLDKTYEEILASKGSEEKDYYTLGKNGVFSMIYGGDHNTLIKKYGIAPEVAKQAFNEWQKDYPDQAKHRQEVLDRFASMRQPKGLGTKVEWHEPAEYIESLFGFKRYFTLENRICRKLFELAQKTWKFQGHCVRRDRVQTIGGATQSACYAAAFNIQSSNMRAACNHVIQSSGAEITKTVQRRLWDLQPCGVSDYKVKPLNIHDEIMCPNKCPDRVAEVVQETVESYREQVPLIKIDWSNHLESWGEK